MAKEIRLIDANAFWNRLNNTVYDLFDPESDFGYSPGIIKAVLDQTKTVDAVEVVHGRWDIFDDGYGCELMCCSVCKSEFYDGDNDTVDQPHNYCPNCGAKMDGEEKDSNLLFADMEEIIDA